MLLGRDSPTRAHEAAKEQGTPHPAGAAATDLRALLDAELSARLAPLEARLDELERLECDRALAGGKLPVSSRQGPAPGSQSKQLSASSGDCAIPCDIEDQHEEEVEVEVGEAGIVEVRPIKETVWECVLLCGTPGVGAAGSCVMIGSVLMNVVLQLLFCVVAVYSFTEDTLPSVQSARRWRLTDAHSLTYMDQTSFVSLAARVCGEDSSLTFANSQNSVLTEVRDYMNTIVILGVEFFGVGQLLCAVVLFVWLLFVVQELQDALAFASVLCALPRSRRTIIAQDGEAYAVKSISAKRFAFLMGVVLCRLTIAVILGYAGALWICHTRRPTQLVLKAAALAFVMDLDELINSTLTPLSASALVERLEPLRRPKGLRWRGLGLHSILGFAAVVPPRGSSSPAMRFPWGRR
jgi:hypothetical protein